MGKAWRPGMGLNPWKGVGWGLLRLRGPPFMWSREPELPVGNQPSDRPPAAGSGSCKGVSSPWSGACKQTKGSQQHLHQGTGQETRFSEDPLTGRSHPGCRRPRGVLPGSWTPLSEAAGSRELENGHSSAPGTRAGRSCLVKRKLGLAAWTACFSSGFFSHSLTTT